MRRIAMSNSIAPQFPLILRHNLHGSCEPIGDFDSNRFGDKAKMVALPSRIPDEATERVDRRYGRCTPAGNRPNIRCIDRATC